MQLDQTQETLYQQFPRTSFLSNKKNLEAVIRWCTFQRRNLPAFVHHYFGIRMHPYQNIWLYYLDNSHALSIIAARATAKSFVIGTFACAKCVLYPGIRIVIASATKGQARLIVKEKIQGILMQRSPNLAREIEKVVDNQNSTEVIFKNGSRIVVVVANDNARGNRANVLILEEYRMIDKHIKDSVLMPFVENYIPPFAMTHDEYSQFITNSFVIGISSSWRKSHWMWKEALGQMEDHYQKGASSFVLAADYSLSLKHNIKSENDIRRDKKNFDPATFRIEYENEMLDETKNAFFTYELLERNQRPNVKPFFPRRTIDVLSKRKNPYDIPKREGEIRLLVCDFAFVERRNNDNSCFLCMRLLPEMREYRANAEDGSVIRTKTGYRRVVPYLEAMPGQDLFKQAVRIKQLYEDFNADYCVIDLRSAGLGIYDNLAKIIYDEERDKEYAPWVCFNDKTISERIRIEGAAEVIYAIEASAQMNSDIARLLRETLANGQIDFLQNLEDAKQDLEEKYPEYLASPSADDQLFFERPFLETQAMISETASLQYEVRQNSQSILIKVHEQGAATKDRYSALSYGNWYADLLESDLLSDDGSYDYGIFIN